LAKAPRPLLRIWRKHPGRLLDPSHLPWGFANHLFYVLRPRFQGPGIVRSARGRNPSSSAASAVPRFARCATARLPHSASLTRNGVQRRFVSLRGAKQACPREGGGSNLLPPWQ